MVQSSAGSRLRYRLRPEGGPAEWDRRYWTGRYPSSSEVVRPREDSDRRGAGPVGGGQRLSAHGRAGCCTEAPPDGRARGSLMVRATLANLLIIRHFGYSTIMPRFSHNRLRRATNSSQPVPNTPLLPAQFSNTRSTVKPDRSRNPVTSLGITDS